MDLGKAEYELMFRQSPLPMWIHDLDEFRFIDVNHAALAELGCTRDEFLARTLFDIRPAAERPRLEATLRNFQQVRNIATELRPGVLDHLGLVAAMEWQASQFTRRSGIPCQFNPPADEPVLSQDQAVSLFRILQESLTNVARHADASHVAVALDADLESVRLTIEDDGVGLSEERRLHRTSLGLTGMEERARVIDARLSIQRRTAGRGTSVIVDLPLKPEEVPV